MEHSRTAYRSLLLARSALARRRRFQHYSTAPTAPHTILPFKIPEPIERSPTELLEALSSTVGVDVTAPHFAFIDDPATIPSSHSRKMHYYMAKEFGKRAARQLAEEWPTLFMFDRDQPRLPVFRPEKPLDPLIVEANEANLLKMITDKHVEDAFKLYERMGSDGVEVSSTTLLELFYLVCYYNGRNVQPDEFREWHGIRSYHRQKEVPPEDHTAVELLFESVEKTADTYSAMICSLIKFPSENSITRAKELFKEMISKKFTPAEEVFNEVLRGHISLTSKKFKVEDILTGMARLGVRPSVRTFNAAIYSTFKTDAKTRVNLTRSLLEEMQACGIVPNLSTFYLCILACCTDAKNINWKAHKEDLPFAASTVLSALDELSAWESISPSEFTDERFFIAAMEVADLTMNVEMGDRLVAIYESPKNKVTFSSFEPESKFYHSYLLLKLATLTLEEFEDIYIAHIPRLTGLSPILNFKIFNRLKSRPIWSFLRRVIEDGVIVGYAQNQKICSLWMEMLVDFPVKNLSESEMDDFRGLVTRLLSIWDDLNSKLNYNMERFQRFEAEAAAEEGNTDETQKSEKSREKGNKRMTDKTLIDYKHFETIMAERGIITPVED